MQGPHVTVGMGHCGDTLLGFRQTVTHDAGEAATYGLLQVSVIPVSPRAGTCHGQREHMRTRSRGASVPVGAVSAAFAELDLLDCRGPCATPKPPIAKPWHGPAVATAMIPAAPEGRNPLSKVTPAVKVAPSPQVKAARPAPAPKVSGSFLSAGANQPVVLDPSPLPAGEPPACVYRPWPAAKFQSRRSQARSARSRRASFSVTDRKPRSRRCSSGCPA